jgi:serine/threonine-protein kinase
MNGDNGGTTARADRLGQILGAYFVAVEDGKAHSRAELMRQHPDLASELAEYFAEQDRLDRMMAPLHAPGPPASSVLDDLTASLGAVPRVVLTETEPAADGGPLVLAHSPEIPALAERPARLQLFGEIARGGMGAILKGRDADLGRELAVKVLLEAHEGSPEMIRRFIEEAQIGGQLQHPGIVPVHELGTFPGLRPYFAMKLVRGRTLAALLAEQISSFSPGKKLPEGRMRVEEPERVGWVKPTNSSSDHMQVNGGFHPPYQDLPRFLSIFEQVCQTVAYAHARGVIHRDLKPANVMVGSFGEVQVMDWGLAKVLPRGGVADESTLRNIHETQVLTVRSGSGADASHAGSVLGTPSYMAPEQARGELDRLDERADVFGLGAILCEILTGKPPFIGRDRRETHEMACRGDLEQAHRLLDGCGADAELVALCRDCLAAEPASRPRTAGEVAARMTAHLTGVQERLRQAKLARVEAQTRAAEERKRRRITVALVASILVTACLIGGGRAYLARQRTGRLLATARVVNEALAEASLLRGQAQQAGADDLTKRSEALGAAKRAQSLLDQGEADAALKNRVALALPDLEREQAAAHERAIEVERDRRFLGDLETIRGNRSEHWDSGRTDAEYAAAFREFGIDVDKLDPKEAGRRLALLSKPVEFASYVDDWALRRNKALGKKEEESWQRLLKAAEVADPDPWRVALRQRRVRDDRDALRRLAADQKALEAQPAPSLVLLASRLIDQGDPELAERVLRQAWQQSPGDFWVNFTRGQAHPGMDFQPGTEEPVRFYSAAVAIRPQSFMAHNNLGYSLKGLRRVDEAMAQWREAIRLKPDDPLAHNSLGNALRGQGKLDEATAQCRQAIRLKPDFAEAHSNLGCALEEQGKLDEAIAEHREAIRLKPNDAGAHMNLGAALATQGKLEEAIAEHRETIRLRPDFAGAHANLGLDLRTLGRLPEAVAALRKARDLAKASPRMLKSIERDLNTVERQAALVARLPAVLRGEEKPKDAAERLEFGFLCHSLRRFSTAASLIAEAFQADPKLAVDTKARNRYNAACAAALAASGRGKDEPPLNEVARARWRKEAIEWLKAHLAYWTKQVETGPPQARPAVAQTLQHWKVDPDLAGIRDNAALAKLPEDERKAGQALWEEVERVAQRAAEAHVAH